MVTLRLYLMANGCASKLILTKKNFTANLVNALKGGFSQQKLDKLVDTRYLRSSKDLPQVPDG